MSDKRTQLRLWYAPLWEYRVVSPDSASGSEYYVFFPIDQMPLRGFMTVPRLLKVRTRPPVRSFL